ncbi:hypothetical protein [Mycobacterium aquaticum]|uniref:Uncharacterized protein n=1 Tax=Mycobacterium aquaticum TaxID=1927124 RepID=A0A1X0AHI0_9MYCO|nr:hypothetical protein [Mycobacterium aquaticum]ORA29298.1 hypothetical protein BST13_27325 [Mycobacterium aquaticum]
MSTASSIRRPIEAIAQRSNASQQCERRVRAALTKLIKSGAPFTVENVCTLAGVGKTFIYDKRRPDLTRAVLNARDASQAATTAKQHAGGENNTASWRERAVNAEALAKSLRQTIRDRESRISDLTGQLYDPEGTHLAESNAKLRQLVASLSGNLRDTELENRKLRRSLTAARANVKHERERSITLISGRHESKIPNEHPNMPLKKRL